MKIMIERRGYGYLAAFAGTAAITALLAPFSARLSSTTVALALLLLILFIATVWGSKSVLFKPHGRVETEALSAGLERIPLKQIEYRGAKESPTSSSANPPARAGMFCCTAR